MGVEERAGKLAPFFVPVQYIHTRAYKKLAGTFIFQPAFCKPSELSVQEYRLPKGNDAMTVGRQFEIDRDVSEQTEYTYQV